MERRARQREPLQQRQVRGGRGEEGGGGATPLPETVCPHKNKLDDYDVADVVCMDCGLVLDRILGGGPKGGGQAGGRWTENVFESPEEVERLLLLSSYNRLPGELRAREMARERIVHYLSQFHMDTEEMADSVLENYWKIYGGRENGKNGFRKSRRKQAVAFTFSLCNVMAKEGVPRPPGFVADVCRLKKEHRKKILQIPKSLNFGREERAQLRRSDYELQESEAEDYIDTLCAFSNVPFHIASRIRETAQRATWLLHGRQPTVLAAASMQIELGRVGLLGRSVSARDICELLECRQKSVTNAIRQLVAAEFRRDGGDAEEEEEAGAGAATAAATDPAEPADESRRRSLHRHQRGHAAGQAHQHGSQGGEGSESRLAGGDLIREGSRQEDSDETETASREIRLQPAGGEQAVDLLQSGEARHALAALGAISQVLRFWPKKTDEQDGGSHPAEREEVMDVATG